MYSSSSDRISAINNNIAKKQTEKDHPNRVVCAKMPLPFSGRGLKYMISGGYFGVTVSSFFNMKSINSARL